MRFSGEITAEIEREFQALYYRRNPLYPIIYSILAIVMLVMGIFLLLRTGVQDIGVFGIVSLLIASVLFVVAYRLPHIWWRWWRPQFFTIFGKHLSGEVSSVGVKLKPDDSEIDWRSFLGVKQTDSMILLYLDKGAAYPIHQSMVNKNSDWIELVNLTKKNVRLRFW